MRQWEVTGANAKTGKDEKIILVAEDESQVLMLAKDRGLLVSKVKAGKELLLEPQPIQNKKSVKYESILKTANTLSTVGELAKAASLVSVFLAIVLGIAAMKEDNSNSASHAIGAATSAFVFFITSLLLKILAATSIAIRDIAINTEKIDPVEINASR